MPNYWGCLCSNLIVEFNFLTKLMYTYLTLSFHQKVEYPEIKINLLVSSTQQTQPLLPSLIFKVHQSMLSILDCPIRIKSANTLLYQILMPRDESPFCQVIAAHLTPNLYFPPLTFRHVTELPLKESSTRLRRRGHLITTAQLI